MGAPDRPAVHRLVSDTGASSATGGTRLPPGAVTVFAVDRVRTRHHHVPLSLSPSARPTHRRS